MTAIQNNESFSQDIQEEKLLFEDKKDENTSQPSKFTRLLQTISLSNYITPLYYKNSRTYASIFSGIGSIIIVILLLTTVVVSFNQMLAKTQYYLTSNISGFNKYLTDQSLENFQLKTCENCFQLTINDLFKEFFGNGRVAYIINTPSQNEEKIQTCNDTFGFVVQTSYVDKQGKIQRNNYVQDITQLSPGKCVIGINPDDLLQTIPSEYLNQTAVIGQEVQSISFLLLPFTIVVGGLLQDSQVFLSSYNPEITENGVNNEILFQQYTKDKNLIHFYDLQLLSEYNSILPLQLQTPVVTPQFYSSYVTENPITNQDQFLIIQYYTNNGMTHYKRYPENILSWVSKMGGIIASINLILLLMTIMNRFLFEAELKQKNQKFEEIFSIEQFDELIQNNRKLTHQVQDLELRSQNNYSLRQDE